MTLRRLSTVAFATCLLFSAPAFANDAGTPAAAATRVDTHGVVFRLGDETLSIRLVGTGTVHVQALPAGVTDTHTLVLDPHARPATAAGVHTQDTKATFTFSDARLAAIWHKQANTLELQDADRHTLLTLDLAALTKHRVEIAHAPGDALYGIHGYDKDESAAAGLLRRGALVAKAGSQGYAGAPFVWSTAGYGVLVDSDGADFALRTNRIDISGLSKPAIDVYLMVGDPPQLFGELADLSGHAPLFPKWANGFLNSQWGIDEKELLSIIHTYRARHIPIDGFILDFDWKAWGEDWGEFRWNEQKFPDGPTGKLKAELDKLGVHLAGIMKPRLHLDTPEGRYATAHDLWLPGEDASLDYFSHKPVKNLDFDKPATRAWFFNDTLKHSFDTGIVGWWNDEADTTQSNTQFLNMERSLYDGQRAHSNLRVWSINRNFWLGAQRYAYGLWSGDIKTGFDSMAAQRARMLSAIDVGEMQWGMDGGGFIGHPSDENYARWIEFGAFTPIFRVHGVFGEKRQPWVYGPVAEAAATKAIRLRYALMPYIYSYQHHASAEGAGLVRPLIFAWPHDPNVRNAMDAWLFGKWLLVSPVVEQGQTSKRIYLPAGQWTDWFTGKTYVGGRTIEVPVDSTTWGDIPLFVRAGAIIPTQPVMDYVGQQPVTEVTVDVFPTTQPTHFDYYDDDGETYAYQQGAYFSQRFSTARNDGVTFTIGAPTGSFKPALRDYLVRLHIDAMGDVVRKDAPLKHYPDLAALREAAGEGWARGHDRFGDVVHVKLRAGMAQSLRIPHDATTDHPESPQ